MRVKCGMRNCRSNLDGKCIVRDILIIGNDRKCNDFYLRTSEQTAKRDE